MLKGLSKFLFARGSDAAAPGPAAQPPESAVQAAAPAAVGPQITETLDPGAPYAFGEPVPRWPERGAAVVAAHPDQLLETQRDVIQRIKSFSPLTPARFDALVLPVFRRYAEWVHLLPASEAHHHFGPGGLLAHGFEVALHAARMADGKQVGMELSPSERALYTPRWRMATMLGGLFHDLGKPLVDCGATDPTNTKTWPAMDGSLYAWLMANGLTHYRIYWRSGARHERHKPVGTAVVREILGHDMLAWLSDEPTQEVVTLLMMSIATGRAANNLMSVVVSQADSLSVEADLKRLAARTQQTGQGGTHSVGALFMAELRKLVESNKIDVNKRGAPLYHTNAGTFGLNPAIIDAVLPALAKKNIPGLPSRADMVQLLADTGYIEGFEEKSKEVERAGAIWALSVKTTNRDEVLLTPDLRAIKFAQPEYIFGNLPLPPELEAQARPPFMTDADRAAAAAAVQVADAPQSAESALGVPHVPPTRPEPPSTPETPPVAAAAPSAPTAPAAVASAATASASEPLQSEPAAGAEGPYIADRKNRRDLADESSIEAERRRDKRTGEGESAADCLAKLETMGFAGPAVSGIIRRIASRKLIWQQDVFETSDGLVVRFPAGLERLGMAPEDILSHCAQQRWLVTDAGSSRKTTERSFPNGQAAKCVVFSGLVHRTWEAVRREFPAIADGQAVTLPGDEEPAGGANDAAAGQVAPQRQSRQQGASDAPRDRGTSSARREAEGARPSGAPSGARPAQGQSAAQGNRSAQEAPARRERKFQPIAGAAPAPGRGPSAPSTVINPVAKAPVDTTGPRPAAMSAAESTLPVIPVQNTGKKYPRGLGDLAADKKSDLNPIKIEWINGMVMRVVLMDMVKHGLDPNDMAQCTPEIIKRALKYYTSRQGGPRIGPMFAVLEDRANPAFIVQLPPTMDIEAIKDIKVNPEYKMPDWVVRVDGKDFLQIARDTVKAHGGKA